jgi:hypothetical protein
LLVFKTDDSLSIRESKRKFCFCKNMMCVGGSEVGY